MMLYCILEELRLSMASFPKIENRLFLCWRVDTCVFVRGFARPAFMQGKSETQTRGFLSECSCCLLVYWVRIYYSAIFLCYVLQSRREREREGKKQRGGPSNSTGVRTHWIVWSSWVARLFLAQSNSLALYWMHWWEKEASRFVPKAVNKH